MDHEFVSYAIIIKYVSDIFLYYLKNPPKLSYHSHRSYFTYNLHNRDCIKFSA